MRMCAIEHALLTSNAVECDNADCPRMKLLKGTGRLVLGVDHQPLTNV